MKITFKQFKKRALAATVCGVLAAMAAGSASAFAPVWQADGNPATTGDRHTDADVEIWHAGASASTLSMQTAVIETFCDVAQPADLLSKGGFWALGCVGKATLPASLAGKKILWNKRDEGGSGVGVGPVVVPGATVGFMLPSTGAGTNCPVASAPIVMSGVTVTPWNCSGFGYSFVPPVAATFDANDESATVDAIMKPVDIGTSDIEPDKFSSSFAENVPAADFDLNGVAGPALPPYTAAGGTPIASLIFNTPVNLLMSQDLQRAQFPAGHALFNDCNPAGIDYLRNPTSGLITNIKDKAVPANSERCMPSLMGSEIRSIFAKGGAIRSAQDFQAETAYQSGAFAQMTATGATDNTIQICRRVKGSGTQAQLNAVILGYPCDATFDTTIDTLTPEGQTGLTTFVSENEGSGDLEKCLNDFNNGTNTSGFNSAARKRWTIGVMSMERNDSLANDYRFIKVDGYAPTLVNVHAGDYYDFVSQSLQTRSGVSSVVTDAVANLVPFMQNPAKLPSLNKTHAFGVSGWLAIPSNVTVPFNMKPDSELDFTRPVNWFQRVSASGKANTCALPSAFKKTGTATNVDITVAPQNCSSDNGSGDQNCYTP